MALALQSCIGGLSDGFKVVQLSDRRFWFSVASNRVGHFIYGLKDRIWPDFICHFHLFRGDLSSCYGHSDLPWHADSELPEVGSRGLAIKSKWLQEQQRKAQHSTPLSLLANIGFEPSSQPAVITGVNQTSNEISFGRFKSLVFSDPDETIRLGDFIFN